MSGLKSLVIPLLFGSLFLISSCEEDNGDMACTAFSFPFLEVGNQLMYYYEPSIFGGEDTVTLTVESQGNDGNYKMVFTSVNIAVLNSTAYYFACNDRIYAGSSPVSTNNSYFLSTDANVGDSWTRAATSGGTIVEHSLLSKTETLVLPAGTFDNVWKITYHQQGTVNTDTIYWRHDIGYVKYSGWLRYHLLSKNF
jgi:hypothetical protein